LEKSLKRESSRIEASRYLEYYFIICSINLAIVISKTIIQTEGGIINSKITPDRGNPGCPPNILKNEEKISK
jgi:hypothetical protein